MSAVSAVPGVARRGWGSSVLPSSRLLPLDALRVASVGLRTRRLRAALSALGVAIGIAAMVAVLGISDSSKAGLVEELNQLGTNLLTVQPGQNFFGQNAQLPEAADRAVLNLPSVRNAAAVTTVSSASVRRSSYIEAAETSGVTVDAADLGLLATLSGKLTHGRFLDAANERYPIVVLGAVAAERLGVNALRVDGRTVQVDISGIWFTVAGVLAPLPLAPEIDRAALIGYPVAHALFGTSRNASTLYVRADPERVSAAASLLPATADPQSPEQTQISRPSSALQARADAQSTLTALFLGLGAVALLVGGVGIANVMVISVLERRPEIGLRRALGATRAHIGVQFLGESVLLSLLGGAAGIGLGAAATAGYAQLQGWIIVVPLLAVGGSVAIAVALGAVAGLYPAARAARLAPASALRSTWAGGRPWRALADAYPARSADASPRREKAPRIAAPAASNANDSTTLTGEPANRPRPASITAVIGFSRETACTQPVSRDRGTYTGARNSATNTGIWIRGPACSVRKNIAIPIAHSAAVKFMPRPRPNSPNSWIPWPSTFIPAIRPAAVTIAATTSQRMKAPTA